MVDPGVAIKKHPSQYGTHRGIDAALELQEKHAVDPERIASVHIRTPVMGYVGRPSPQTGLEGKFSFQYTVAAALLDRRITIDTFTDANVLRPEIQALLAKTEVEMSPDIPANFEDMWISVQVTTTGGQTFQTRCDRPRGIWGNPLSRDERLTKVRQCAARVVSDSAVESFIEIVEDLENAPASRVQDLIETLMS
jgi:aconitate decarboxylase